MTEPGEAEEVLLRRRGAGGDAGGQEHGVTADGGPSREHVPHRGEQPD